MIKENKITELTKEANSIQTAINYGAPEYGRKGRTTQNEYSFSIYYHSKGECAPWKPFLNHAVEMMWDEIADLAKTLAEGGVKEIKDSITEQVVSLLKEL